MEEYDSSVDLFKVNDYDLKINNNNFVFTNSRIESILTTHSRGYGGLERANALRYFHRPSFRHYPIDLKSVAMPSVTAWNELERKKNSKVEHYITATVRQMDCNTNAFLSNYNILTQRNALQRLMLTPYQPQHSWVMMATRYNEKIYLNQWSDENCRWYWNEKDDFEQRFERLCFAGTPTGAKLPGKPCKLYAVCSAKLKAFNLLWSSEIAGVNSDKVVRYMNNPKHVNNCNIILPKLLPDEANWCLRYNKMLEIVTEAALMRARDVCIGFANRDGVLTKPLRVCTVDELSEFQPWKLHCCLGFLHKFLLTMNSLMDKNNNPYKIFVFRYDPKTQKVSYRLRVDDRDHRFLSQRYIDAAFVRPPPLAPTVVEAVANYDIRQ